MTRTFNVPRGAMSGRPWGQVMAVNGCLVGDHVLVDFVCVEVTGWSSDELPGWVEVERRESDGRSDPDRQGAGLRCRRYLIVAPGRGDRGEAPAAALI
ncbi:hypothetical protein Vau01_109700 [Virgisporangium aurantiacum]|uniref:Uncharacterized protein n=1 Tax=Virgisporangium aurantiacum TaxID=175570 RepID=A0A8J3ZG07_9ACTN|nr:hypothetical protein Vau01_109700 [Virgisporangium aurantiacum]